MKIKITAIWMGAALAAGLMTASAVPADTQVFSATLLGDNEVPPINTDGKAAFRMEVGNSITFSLTFSGLSTPLVVSHLHFAPTKVAGGVMIFLCGGGNQPVCPAGHVGNHYRDDHGGQRHRTGAPRHRPRRPHVSPGGRGRWQRLREHAHHQVSQRRDSRPGRA